MKKPDANLLIVLSTIGIGIVIFFAAAIAALSTFPPNPADPVVIPATEMSPSPSPEL